MKLEKTKQNNIHAAQEVSLESKTKAFTTTSLNKNTLRDNHLNNEGTFFDINTLDNDNEGRFAMDDEFIFGNLTDFNDEDINLQSRKLETKDTHINNEKNIADYTRIEFEKICENLQSGETYLPDGQTLQNVNVLPSNQEFSSPLMKSTSKREGSIHHKIKDSKKMILHAIKKGNKVSKLKMSCPKKRKTNAKDNGKKKKTGNILDHNEFQHRLENTKKSKHGLK